MPAGIKGIPFRKKVMTIGLHDAEREHLKNKHLAEVEEFESNK